MQKMEKVYINEIPISWNSTYCLSGENVSYKIYYSLDPWNSEKIKVIEDIQDTSYILKNLTPGKYYLRVEASNGGFTQTATDKYNRFEVRESTELPCQINTNMVLTEEGSPYIANCAIVVNPGVKLEILEGVEIWINGFYNFEVRGEIDVRGTVEKPVIFKPAIGVNKFREFYMSKPTGNCYFQNVEFHNCNIKAYEGKYDFNKVKIVINDTSIKDDAIYAEKADFKITNSLIIGNDTTEGVIVFYSNSPMIDSCTAIHTADAFQYVACENGVISNNIAIEPQDEGIDLNGCTNILIKGNVIINPSDNCVSIGDDSFGPSKNIKVLNNIVKGSNKSGFELKSGSTIYLQNNDIIDCEVGIHEYEKIKTDEKVNVTAVNNIFYNNNLDIFLEDSSQLILNYSISNKSLLDGENNIFGDPLFIDYEKDNYNLRKNSPCIDAGDPAIEFDPDGTRADIGAYYFNQNIPRIVINEINYNSADDFDTGDWIELYNNDLNDIDLSGWLFRDNDKTHIFKIPDGTILKRGEYLVICNDKNSFKNLFPNVTNYIGDFDFGLSGSGDEVRIYDSTGLLIDSVAYGVTAPWSEAADGQGMTLELISPDLDNTLPESWKASYKLHGSPGQANSVLNDVNKDTHLFKVFPNPARDKIFIDFNNEKISIIEIFDVNGKIVAITDKFFPYIDISKLPSGIYYLKIGNTLVGFVKYE